MVSQSTEDQRTRSFKVFYGSGAVTNTQQQMMIEIKSSVKPQPHSIQLKVILTCSQ